MVVAGRKDHDRVQIRGEEAAPKSGSVLALRPDFFSGAPSGSYSYDLSEPDRTARLLASPESAYGARWSTGTAVIEHVAVIVREPPGWVPPAAAVSAGRSRNPGQLSP